MRNSKDFSIEYIQYCCGISWFIRNGSSSCTQEPKALVHPPHPHTRGTAGLPQGRDNALDTPSRLGHTDLLPGLKESKDPHGETEKQNSDWELGLGSRQCFLYGPITVCQYNTPRVPLWVRGLGSPQTALPCDLVQRGACSEGRDRRNCHSFSSFFHSGLQPDTYNNTQSTFMYNLNKGHATTSKCLIPTLKLHV